jgi:topoisomerase-4 subunit A
VVYFDAEQNYYYVKRFQVELNGSKPCRFIGDYSENKMISFTWVTYPRLEIEFGEENASRENEIIEVAEFIGIKSYKAKGKRLSNYSVKNIREIEPVVKDEDQKPVEEIELIEDIPFEIIRTSGETDHNQMELNFEE